MRTTLKMKLSRLSLGLGCLCFALDSLAEGNHPVGKNSIGGSLHIDAKVKKIISQPLAIGAESQVKFNTVGESKIGGSVNLNSKTDVSMARAHGQSLISARPGP